MNARTLEFHKPDVLRRLALSDSGFVFDPLSGASFTVNATGLALIRLLQEEGRGDIGEIVAELRDIYEVDASTAERDMIEFAGVLRSNFK